MTRSSRFLHQGIYVFFMSLRSLFSPAIRCCHASAKMLVFWQSMKRTVFRSGDMNLGPPIGNWRMYAVS
ncbi:unnamed protein product [Gongylonema pulchrum]|uniref:Secreted protein n=1 Tax=Gongylonema pulchrum TaxID=637853 RepID=A0A183ERZ6_9BILA|nr:unnamed protein product [Gongylonema pulchrum]